MNPESAGPQLPVFGALTGLAIDSEFTLPYGISVRPTYAYLFAPMLMAFSPAQPGKAHPAPWKDVKGGFQFEIFAEIEVRELRPKFFDPLNTIWWFASLCRLKVNHRISVPAVSDVPIETMRASSTRGTIWSIEVSPHRSLSGPESALKLTDDDA